MDLDKIGKFIASCRKDKKITQEQLAEKLYITDRAVSKWERGLSLPDADKMLDLCNILDINVNELLMGERIDMKDYDKKNEELLIEMAKQEELKNKKLIMDMYILTGTAIVFYIAITLLACFTLEEGPLLGAIICISTIVVVFVGFYGLKLELDAGYYECNNCHHRFVPKSYFAIMLAPHINTTRYLKCPKCNKRSMAKKVMTK
jgi:transcriptional regulator with XRE-family HTH domain/DNA-directed RNA polymerase subunit RPC12/RpoP